jgi:hypothetical protein
MFERLMGIISLKAPVYKQVAEDKSAMKDAVIIVVVVSLIQGLMVGSLPDTGGINIGGGVAQAILTMVFALLGWVVTAWLLAMVAKSFGGDTDMNEMLRVTGHVYIFNLVVILRLTILISSALLCATSIVGVIALVLSIIGYVIGVREAAGFTTGKAVATAVIAAIGGYVITGPLSSMISGLFL